MAERAIAFALAVLLAAPVRAADPEPSASQVEAPSGQERDLASRHFERGLEFVDRSDFAAAAVEFQAAYDLRPHYVVLYNLGLAYAATARPVEAADALQRFLIEAGDKAPQERRMEAQRELRRQQARIAHLQVKVEPADARVEIDGTVTDPARLKEEGLAVAAGLHRVRATAPDRAAAERVITLLGEETRLLEITLAPAAAGPPQGEVPAQNVAASEAAAPLQRLGEANTVLPAPAATSTSMGTARMAAHATVGAGAALAVAAAAVFAWNRTRYESYRQEANELARTSSGDPYAYDRRLDANHEDLRSVQDVGAVNLALVAASVALLATGGALEWRYRDRRTNVAIGTSLSPSSHTSALSLGGRW